MNVYIYKFKKIEFLKCNNCPLFNRANGFCKALEKKVPEGEMRNRRLKSCPIEFVKEDNSNEQSI